MTVPTTKVPVLTYTLFQTTDYFETMRMVTGGIVLPLTSVFGMITNVFNMAVYISEGLMVNINNMSLFSLAIADFMLCALSSFTYSDYFFGPIFSETTYVFRLLQYNLFFRSVFMFYQANMYIVMKIVLERFIAVRFPFKSRQYITVKRSMAVNIGVWVFTFSSHLWFFPDWAYLIAMTVTTNNTSAGVTSAMLSHPEESSTMARYQDLHEIVSNTSVLGEQPAMLSSYDLHYFSNVPLVNNFYRFYVQPVRYFSVVFVSICSLGMMVELWRHSRRRRAMTGKTQSSVKIKKIAKSTTGSAGSVDTCIPPGVTHEQQQQRQRQSSGGHQLTKTERRDARVALGIGILFICSFSAIFLSFTRTTMCQAVKLCHAIDFNPIMEKWYFLTQIVSLLYLFGSCSNFFLYLAVNKRFREKFIILFCRCCRKKR